LGQRRCESDYCGGCNRHFYNANGVEICVSAARSTKSCDENLDECPKCPGDSDTIYDDGECCPRCSKKMKDDLDCRVVLCNPAPACDQGWELHTAQDECCPRCRPRADCPPLCKMLCKNGHKTDDQGCSICECNSRNQRNERILAPLLQQP
jgi:hypothetical protein